MEASKMCSVLDELQRLQMSIGEMAVLSMLLWQPMHAHDIVGFTEGHWRGDEFEQPVEAYAQALRTCVDKTWIKSVSVEESEALQSQVEDDSIIGTRNQRG
jgi:hypothetical protein